MANVIHMPDGTESIFFDDDELALRQLIKDRLGYDALEIYDSVIKEREYYKHKVEYGYGQDEDEDETLADILMAEVHKTMLQKEPVVPISSVKQEPSTSDYDDEDAIPF